MNAYVAEFVGTFLFVIFGNGVVANVVLARTKGHGSGWIVISAAWAFARFHWCLLRGALQRGGNRQRHEIDFSHCIGKRNWITGNMFVKDVSNRVSGPVQTATDDLPSYPFHIRQHFGYE